MVNIDDNLINEVLKYNTFDYNINKAVEELQELSLILTQFKNKPEKIQIGDIIDEIGDVHLRLRILDKLFGEQEVQERVQYKEEKYKEYLEKKTNKFKNI